MMSSCRLSLRNPVLGCARILSPIFCNFCLLDTPSPSSVRACQSRSAKNAWLYGRSFFPTFILFISDRTSHALLPSMSEEAIVHEEHNRPAGAACSSIGSSVNQHHPPTWLRALLLLLTAQLNRRTIREMVETPGMQFPADVQDGGILTGGDDREVWRHIPSPSTFPTHPGPVRCNRSVA
eukprot:354567-Chlamydomonas_euryale.AAC.2